MLLSAFVIIAFISTVFGKQASPTPSNAPGGTDSVIFNQLKERTLEKGIDRGPASTVDSCISLLGSKYSLGYWDSSAKKCFSSDDVKNSTTAVTLYFAGPNGASLTSNIVKYKLSARPVKTRTHILWTGDTPNARLQWFKDCDLAQDASIGNKGTVDCIKYRQKTGNVVLVSVPKPVTKK